MPDLLYEIGTEEVPAGYLEPALAQLAEVLRQPAGGGAPGAAARPDRRHAATPGRLRAGPAGAPAAAALHRHRPACEGGLRRGRQPHAPPPRGSPAAGASRSSPCRSRRPSAARTSWPSSSSRGATRPRCCPPCWRRRPPPSSFPKSMRWEPSGFQFARPVRSLVALLGDQVLPLEIAGVQAGRVTGGHPFLAPVAIELKNASWDLYLEALRDECVVADVDERREIVRREINALLAAARHGAGRRGAAGGGHEPGRVAARGRGRLRRALPGRARARPDRRDEGAPALLPRARRRGPAGRALRHRLQPHRRAGRPGARGQRARAAGAAGGREVLLGGGPPPQPRRAGPAPGGRHLPGRPGQQPAAHRAPGRAERAHRRTRRHRRGDRAPRRAALQGGPADGPRRRVPEPAGHRRLRAGPRAGRAGARRPRHRRALPARGR